jgi:hypothetical protein
LTEENTSFTLHPYCVIQNHDNNTFLPFPAAGNEASTAEFYTAAAFIAKVPPFEERGQLNAAAAAKALTPAIVHTNPHDLPGPSGHSGRSKRKAAEAAGDSDPDYDSEADSEQENRGKHRRSGAAAAAAANKGAAAPPDLFPPPKPEHMTAAQRRKAALDKERVIHVTGGWVPNAR